MQDAGKDYIAGVLAGSAGMIAGYPFDTVKVRLQSVSGSQYRGPLHCTVSILRTEGIGGFFRGLTAPLVGGALETGLNYFLFERALEYTKKSGWLGLSRFQGVFISGCAAGVGIAVVLTPVELVKCRMQVDVKQMYRSAWDCYRDVLKRDGLRGLMRGFAATEAREIIGNGLYFWSYALAKDKLEQHQEGETPSGLHKVGISILAGGLAGMLFWAVVLPIDVVKTNMQVSTGSYQSMTKSTVQILKQRGIRGFYAGLGTSLVRAFPANAAVWVAWELASSYLKSSSKMHSTAN
ncbi:hypothetical protein NDN08_006639 [Rhodosorus marinus]|uniref:Mitochondrial carrier protein n=1 Tax=Rhodosorus marinus TaxID=101924 RepID=A0AAV8UNJ5_9RHOD|nr:hypothetical protein NDN08_006639 [Rhodosorus marinus]